MMPQFFTGIHGEGHLAVECLFRTTLANDNLCCLTACYLLEQQPWFKLFPNTLCTSGRFVNMIMTR
jgi:hypothetical protein